MTVMIRSEIDLQLLRDLRNIKLGIGLRTSIRIIPWWSNLGCLGFKIGSDYMDVFTRPYFGLYIQIGPVKRWYRITLFGLRLNALAVGSRWLRLKGDNYFGRKGVPDDVC